MDGSLKPNAQNYNTNKGLPLSAYPFSSSRASLSQPNSFTTANTGFSSSAAGGFQDDDGYTTKHSPKKVKKTVAKHKNKKAIKKKPDDMPRRPLSAYNYFFSEMRTKLVEARAAGKDRGFQQFLAMQGNASDGSKKNGFFSNMGKYVAKRWKELSPKEIKPYTDRADEDLERYRREMDEYREGVARKTRLASERKLQEQDNLKEEEELDLKKESKPLSQTALGQSDHTTGPVGQVMTPSSQEPSLQATVPSQQYAAQLSSQSNLIQSGLDPAYQLLLRQQLLGGQNSQLNALLLQQQQQQLVNSQARPPAGLVSTGHPLVPGYSHMLVQSDLASRQTELSVGMNIHQPGVQHHLQNSVGLLNETSHLTNGSASALSGMESHFAQLAGQPGTAMQQLDSLAGYTTLPGQTGDHHRNGQLQLNQSILGQQLTGQSPYTMLGLQTQQPSNSSGSRTFTSGINGGAYL